MTEVDAPAPDPLKARPPRTDWLFSPGRVVVVTLVAIPFVSGLVAAFFSGRYGERNAAGPLAVVLAVALLGAWGSFAIRRGARASRARSTVAMAQPWRAKDEWSREVVERVAALRPSGTVATVRRYLKGSALLAIAAGLAMGGSAGSGPTLLAGFASLAVAALVNLRGYVQVRLQSREQPGRTGGPVHLVVRMAPFPSGGFDRAEMTLRCVVETARRGGRGRPAVACPFSAVRRFGDELFDGAVALHARFDVPAGLPATDPDGEPAVFWELVVAADRGGSRFEETFLVPVYASLS